MSQRCKTQESTDDILKRIRSIILLHRPHLISRIDLQIPELITEALIPNTGSNQITHNFNYKYDYNSNVPTAIPPNPFVQNDNSRQETFYGQPGNIPVQMFTFNQTPSNNQQPQPQPPPAQPSSAATNIVTSFPTQCTTVVLADEDTVLLNETYQRTLRSSTILTYKQLINVLTSVSQKYILSEVFITSLVRLETFDSLLSNDLRELVDCIQRTTNWTLSGSGSLANICQIVSLVITAYCRLASTITRSSTFNLSNFSSIQQMRTQIESIQSNLNELVANNDTVAMETDQIVNLNNRIERMQNEIAERDSTIMTLNTRSSLLNQRIQSLESANTVLISSFNSLARTFNVANVASAENVNSVETVTISITDRLREKQNQIRNLETTLGQAKLENINASSKLQSDLRKAQADLERTTQSLISVQSQLNERTSSAESGLVALKDQLVTIREENQTLQTTVNSLTAELNAAREENSTLRSESLRPVARTKPYNRPTTSTGLGTDTNLDARLRGLQRVVQDTEAINVRLSNENTELKNEISRLQQEKYEMSTTNQSSCDRLQIDVDNVKQKVENLIQNQATLNLQDINTLNQKTTDYYNIKLSELTNENQSLREALDNDITVQSDKLTDRFNIAEINLQNKIERLASQINPILERTQLAENYINSLKNNYEVLARNSSINRETSE